MLGGTLRSGLLFLAGVLPIRSPLGSQSILSQHGYERDTSLLKPSLAFHCSLDKNQQGVAVSVYNDTGHLMKGDDRPRPRVLALYSPSQMENPAVTTAVPTEGTSLPGLRVPTGAPHLG